MFFFNIFNISLVLIKREMLGKIWLIYKGIPLKCELLSSIINK